MQTRADGRARGRVPVPLPPPVKAVPPALPASIVPRPRLERLLDDASQRRVTVVVADAGFGKSTLLSAWVVRQVGAWYSLTSADRDLRAVASGIVAALSLRVPALVPRTARLLEAALGPEAATDQRALARACAGVIADALASNLVRDLVLVLDDVQELDRDGPAAAFIEGLCRQTPPALHFVLASREDPPFSIERLRGQGQVAWLSGAMLAFDGPETRAVVADALEPDEPLADRIYALTQGWPTAVRLAVEACRDLPPSERAATVARLARPAGALYTYLAAEVIDREPPAVRELLETTTALPRFLPELCRDLGLADAEQTIGSLAARGLFVQPLGAGGWFELHPLVREHLAARVERAELVNVAARAAGWFEQRGLIREALACLLVAGDRAGVAAQLRRHGWEVLAAGDVDAIISAAAVLDDGLRDPTIERLEGEALQVRGDWAGALACFERTAAGGDRLEAGLAWRMGLIHHLRGDLDAALDTYHRGGGHETSASADRDVALLRAWTASLHWLRGDAADCRRAANAAMETAVTAGDDQALAAAHTVAGMLAALDGDRRANDAHYIRALEHAGRAGDLLQAIRIRANRGSHFMEEGYYDEALAELDDAIREAEVAGFAAFHALALSNRGEALWRLGRLDEAIADLELARDLYQRLDSRLVSYPLNHLAAVHVDRGARSLARAAYEEAIAVAEPIGDVQGLRPALAGLAEILAASEPLRAAALAVRALELGPGIGRAQALLAVGRVALWRGEPGAARSAAEEAVAEARSRRDRASLADGLVLQGLASQDGRAARPLLEEALVVWQDLRSPINAARTELLLADIADEVDSPAVADEARALLRRAGARDWWPTLPAPSVFQAHRGVPAEIAMVTLGGFELLRAGRPVGLSEWGSRKARDLVKHLVARRGRRVPREQLMETLWPGEDPARSARRLSVLLSTARGVLDPGRRHQASWLIGADRDALWLVGDLANIDVEQFLREAAEGLAEAGRGAAGLASLRAAEAAYGGDFLGQETYDDWAVELREEARLAYLRVCRELARISRERGEHEEATRYLRRMLGQDPYDEKAHLELVAVLGAAGRPGDARRAYRAYLARMEELGVEAAAFPT